jgi:hypothetical protein
MEDSKLRLISAAPGWTAGGKPIIAWEDSPEYHYLYLVPIVWNPETKRSEHARPEDEVKKPPKPQVIS